MPRGDRTGPAGFGPFTGRAAGYCAGFGMPGYSNRVGRHWPRVRGLGMGAGAGFGAGYGWRRRCYAPEGMFWARGYYPYHAAVYPDAEAKRRYEAADLELEAKILKEQLEKIEARLEELKKEQKENPDE